MEEDILRGCSRSVLFSKIKESQTSWHQRHFEKYLIWKFIYFFEAGGFKKFP